jgi:hypothetical protein
LGSFRKKRLFFACSRRFGRIFTAKRQLSFRKKRFSFAFVVAQEKFVGIGGDRYLDLEKLADGLVHFCRVLVDEPM